MEWNQMTYDMWMLFSASMQAQAIWFAGCAFLIWVGFRFSNNIYNDSSTPLVGKVMATAFCGSVALFTLGNMAQVGGIRQGVGAVFAALEADGATLSEGAANLAASVNDPAVGIVQWVFIGSVIIMQLFQIWMKKS